MTLELTERARRRFSLEQEGVVIVGIDCLDELVAAVEARWPTHPFGSRERLAEVVGAVVDAMRFARAVDFWMLRLTPRALIRNHGIRIGDRAVSTTRGWARKKYFSRKDQVDLRGWTVDKYATRMSELLARVLDKKPGEVAEVVETLAEKLRDVGLLTASSAEGRAREMVDHQRIVVERRVGQPLWRCDRCGKVRGATLTSSSGDRLCVNWRCAGTPQPFEPATERDFYRGQYVDEPRRLVVREHSGQVAADERLALEASFNNPEHVMVDVLACTPTLEVGVSLDDLNAVILRNLPPSPANYAQRVGRAGRRSKVALAIAHAGQSPHDSYFFERPVELIAGLVKAPTISLDNEPLLRRHVNSLLFETLGVDLPERWVPPIGYASTDPSIADETESSARRRSRPSRQALPIRDTRARIEAAVRGAFASPTDPAPPARAEEFALDQVANFVEELRAALNRWCDRYRLLVEEYQRLRGKLGLPSETEQKYERRLLAEIQRLAEPSSPEYQPLGFLGLVGFLPRYGFTGETVLLHPPFGDEPIGQAAHVAVTEFAPGNVVYARGRRLKVRRLDPAPIPEADAGAEHRDNVLREGRRCDECEYLTFEPLEKSCPACGRDLVTQRVVRTHRRCGVRAGDLERRRVPHPRTVRPRLLPRRHSVDRRPSSSSAGSSWSGRREGRSPSLTAALALTHLTDRSASTSAPAAAGRTRRQRTRTATTMRTTRGGHAPRCPGIKDASGDVLRSGVWLSAAIRGEALEIELPAAARGAGTSNGG